MEKLDKVERLRERANVTYEEAREALEQSGEDLLDAMVWLERQGKVKTPQQSSYSTSYEEQKEYVRVVDKVEEQKQSAPSFGKSIGRAVRTLMHFVFHTSFHITRKKKILFTMPSWVFAFILLGAWKGVIPVMAVAMMFGVRYSFEGEENSPASEAANDFLNKAGSFADGVQSELNREKPSDNRQQGNMN